MAPTKKTGTLAASSAGRKAFRGATRMKTGVPKSKADTQFASRKGK